MNRSEIQQAVYSAVNDIRSEVSRISHVLEGMNRLTRDVQDINRRVQNLERGLNQIQNTVTMTLGNSQGQRHPDPRVAAIGADVAELKIRFASVEKFAVQMGDYMRRRYQQEEEDRQYRMV